MITVATGMAVQAKGGASRQELIDVADMAMKDLAGRTKGIVRPEQIAAHKMHAPMSPSTVILLRLQCRNWLTE